MKGVPEGLECLAIVLGALYLRGAPREATLAKRRWPLVESALRRSGCDLAQAPSTLLDAGLWPEAIALEQPNLLAWSEARFDVGAFVTIVSDIYPQAWVDKLGATAPPALWAVGDLPSGPFLGIVGSRHVARDILEFARGVGEEAVSLGYSVVSGGAQGCDSAGAAGAIGSVLEVLPFGLEGHKRPHAALSACAPDEPFSTANAMERNALIYSASEQSVVVHARFREGGTWHGATDALRRRLCPLLVRDDYSSQAHRALVALGACALPNPAGLSEALARPVGQARLLLA